MVDFATAAPIGYGRAAARYYAEFLSGIPLCLGYAWALWDPERQGWHDKLAGTVVVPESAYPVASWPGSRPGAG